MLPPHPQWDEITPQLSHFADKPTVKKKNVVAPCSLRDIVVSIFFVADLLVV
jgi:hypothetical protein